MGHSEMDTNAVYSHEMQGDMSKIADYVQRAFLKFWTKKCKSVYFVVYFAEIRKIVAL